MILDDELAIIYFSESVHLIYKALLEFFISIYNFTGDYFYCEFAGF
jgi:hypothetical protein